MEAKGPPMVSVIVPVYHVEKYIAKCIESILSQTYQNFELILVDDGSPDKSGEICDEYARKDHRIRVIHLQNGGVSRARNTGINCAKGEYLFFVDSDDWVEPDFIKYMLPQGEEDLVYVGYTKDFEDGRTERVEQVEQIITVTKENRDFIQRIQITFSVCGCYKADLCRRHSIAFDETVAVGEDVRFILQYLEYVRCIRFTNRTDYHYLQNPKSVVNRYHPDRLENQARECRDIEKFMGKEDMQLRWYRWQTVRIHYEKWMRSKEASVDVKREAKAKLKQTYKDAYFRSCLKVVRKRGSVDQKIESYFMRYALHPFYAPCYRGVMGLVKIKRLLVRS